MTAEMKRKLAGWFETSFWVDIHYLLAGVGTLVVFARYAVTGTIDLGMAGFVSGMWVTAVGNDRLNMPTVDK